MSILGNLMKDVFSREDPASAGRTVHYASATRSIQNRYVDLLIESLLNAIYVENEARFFYIFSSVVANAPIEFGVVREISSARPDLVHAVRLAGEDGRVWWRADITRAGEVETFDLRNVCQFSHTMVGRKRLRNIVQCLDVIRDEKIPGDLIETGVWRGGACILMRGYLEAWEIADKVVWAADSFEGLPKPSLPQDAGQDYSPHVVPVLAISLEEVMENFRRYDLLDDRVKFIKGWFRDTLHSAPINDLALLRLDGDLYESTMDSLHALYDKVVPGGFVIVDDYGDFEPCRRAIDEFRTQNVIRDPLEVIDWTGVFWRKSR